MAKATTNWTPPSKVSTGWAPSTVLDTGVQAGSMTVQADSATVTALGYTEGTSFIGTQPRTDWAKPAKTTAEWTRPAKTTAGWTPSTFDALAVRLDSTTVTLDSTTVTLLGITAGTSWIGTKNRTEWTPTP